MIGILTDIGVAQSITAQNNEGFFIYPYTFGVSNIKGTITPPDGPARTGANAGLWYQAAVSSRLKINNNTVEFICTIPPNVPEAGGNFQDIEEIYIWGRTDPLNPATEFLLAIGQPQPTKIEYRPLTGAVTFKLQLSLTNVDLSAQYIFAYTQAFEISEHNVDPNAHPEIIDVANKAGLFLDAGGKPFSYMGQGFDDKAAFDSVIENGELGYWNESEKRFERALADGTVKQKVVGVIEITDTTNHKGIVRTNGLINVSFVKFETGTVLDAGTRLYLSSTNAGKFTDKITNIPIGRIITKGNYPSYPDYLLLSLEASDHNIDSHAHPNLNKLFIGSQFSFKGGGLVDFISNDLTWTEEFYLVNPFYGEYKIDPGSLLNFANADLLYTNIYKSHKFLTDGDVTGEIQLVNISDFNDNDLVTIGDKNSNKITGYIKGTPSGNNIIVDDGVGNVLDLSSFTLDQGSWIMRLNTSLKKDRVNKGELRPDEEGNINSSVFVVGVCVSNSIFLIDGREITKRWIYEESVQTITDINPGDNIVIPVDSRNGDAEKKYRNGTGDFELSIDGEEQERYKIEIISSFQPTSYTSGTGVVSIPDSVDLSKIGRGCWFVDLDGNDFIIIGDVSNETGNKQFRIATGQTVNLGDGATICYQDYEETGSFHDFRNNITSKKYIPAGAILKFKIYPLIGGSGSGGGGSGEINTAINIGDSGLGVYHQKSGVQFQFKKIKSGTNVSIVETPSHELEINASGGGSGVGVDFKIQLGSGNTITDKVSNAPVGGVPSGWTIVDSTHGLVHAQLSGNLDDIVFIHGQNKIAVIAGLVSQSAFGGYEHKIPSGADTFQPADIKTEDENANQTRIKNFNTLVGNQKSWIWIKLLPILS